MSVSTTPSDAGRFRREVGSFFEDPGPLPPGTSQSIDVDWVLVNSGRAALLALLRASTPPTGRVWFPSYYCHDVVEYVAREFDIRRYAHDPIGRSSLADAPVLPSDRVVVPSYFGAEPAPTALPAPQLILDVTHDPWAEWIEHHRASWLFGSLRKTLPLPEGGFVVNRGGQQFPLQLDSGSKSRVAVAVARQAMLQKALWLRSGVGAAKEPWYSALQENEARLGCLEPSAMQPETRALLFDCPIPQWQATRAGNRRVLERALSGLAGIRILPGPYALVALFDTYEMATRVHRAAISQSIYPARLWPQAADGREEDRRISERLLVFHTDHRYTPADMLDVADVAKKVLEEAHV